MVGSVANGNPFRPGAGQMPPFLAGRERDLELAENRLADLAGGKPPAQGLLFFGPRGNGKTVLLERVREDARRRGMRAERLGAGAFRSEARLLRELQRRAGVDGGRLTGVQVASVGLTAERAALSEDHFELFAQWIRADSAPLVILLDEAHSLASDTARDFFEAAQIAGSEALPFVLIAAGTPDAPRALRRAGTFTERMLERRRVGRLDDAAAAAALAKPAKRTGRPMEDDALALLVGESQRYPYFVQLLGSAAWDEAARAGENRIGREAAERGIAAARLRTQVFYQERFAEARERGIHAALRPLAERMAEHGGRIGDPELDSLLEEGAAARGGLDDPGRIHIALQDLGVIWEVSSGVWEMGIPSFADHILERTEDARPFVATG